MKKPLITYLIIDERDNKITIHRAQGDYNLVIGYCDFFEEGEISKHTSEEDEEGLDDVFTLKDARLCNSCFSTDEILYAYKIPKTWSIEDIK